jgi:hypothetical protein
MVIAMLVYIEDDMFSKRGDGIYCIINVIIIILLNFESNFFSHGSGVQSTHHFHKEANKNLEKKEKTSCG